jgi:very-short-patch-repair endonuclease
MIATSMAVTLLDLCRRLSLIEAAVIADAALHARITSLEELSRWVAMNARRHGIRKLRRALTYAEPAAESPMETRLRMILELGGLPRPRAQVPIRDAAGQVVGRPDLYYERERVGIEYDGANHRDRMIEDNRRQNLLLNAGVRLMRFTAADVMSRPAAVVAEVRAQLEFSGKIPRSA